MKRIDDHRSCQPGGAIADGRIVGTLQWKEPDRGFDLEIDVAVSPEDHGELLPVDGSEPGKAYRAFHQAIRSRDEISLHMAFSNTVNAIWTEAAAAGDGWSRSP